MKCCVCGHSPSKLVILKDCLRCGIGFVRSHARQRYCSQECTDAARKRSQWEWVEKHRPELNEKRRKVLCA